MERNIGVVYIIHRDGIPLLTVGLSGSSMSSIPSFDELFGGFISAVNTLIQQLGHRELRSISVEDGLLVYSFRDPVIFVAYTNDTDSERFANYLVRQVEYEFFQEFGDVIRDEDIFVRPDLFRPFRLTVINLYEQMEQIERQFPRVLDFLPEFVPLHYIYMITNLGTDMTKSFPEGTIAAIRRLPLYFGEATDVQHLVAQTLGRYLGSHVAVDRLGDFVVTPEDTLRLLNEISVCRYDRDREFFDIPICPECRGITADEPLCYFFLGFIEGAIGNPSVEVKETACRARGDKTCRFQLTRTERRV